MTEKPILVFDLDGTLADTKPDLLDALNYCLQKQNMAAVSAAKLSRYIGHGGRVMIEQALREHGRAAEEELTAAMLRDFLDYYTANIPGKSRYFNGVAEVLQNFAEAGYIFAVCTNKAEALAKKLLNALNAQLNMPCPFAALCGGDSLAWKKPDPRHIFSAIAQAGGDKDRAIMIGDSAPDILAARNAGIPSVAVSFGYSDVPIAELQPSIIIDSYAELTPALAAKLLAAQR